MGDVLRRLVARTVAQVLGNNFKAATAPHQYALTTRSGCESIAHVLQGLTWTHRQLCCQWTELERLI